MATPEEIKRNKQEFEKSKKAGGIVAPYEDISFDKAGNPNVVDRKKIKSTVSKKKKK